MFVYAVTVQLSFLAFFFGMSRYFRTSDSVNRDYFEVFGNGLIIFYFLMVVPLAIALWIQVYKGIWKLQIGKASKAIMTALFAVMTLVVSFAGFYGHMLFYYGFAP